MSEPTITKPYEMYLTLAGVDRVIRGVLQRELEPYDIGIMDWLLLSFVHDGPKEGCNMSSIARALGVTLPQVTALTNRLLKLRLIRQKTQVSDRRTRHVTLLPAGQDIANEVARKVAERLADWVSKDDRITRADIEEYLRIATLIQDCRPADQSDL